MKGDKGRYLQQDKFFSNFNTISSNSNCSFCDLKIKPGQGQWCGKYKFPELECEGE